MSDYGPGRKNQYFVPGEGIAREVITADVCKYLDNDATVRPMNYQVGNSYLETTVELLLTISQGA